MKLSEHFTLEELSFSEAASRLGLDNTPGVSVMVSLTRLATCMELVSILLGGKSILVHSAYRSPATNKLVGGVITSAHCSGLACDFVCPGFGPPEIVATAILNSDIEYDQLIREYGWVHLALAREGLHPRRQALTKRSATAAYEVGIAV
jgi:zinc D-Ala-D-Ala carboxypeptidase